jgi:hypothetical protein
MNWKWRALAGTLLLAGTVIWLPMAVTTNAATPLGSASTVVRGPALDDNSADNSGDSDNGDSDNSGSDNGSDDNTNNNDNSSGNNNNNDNTSGNNNNNDNVTNPTPTPIPNQPPPPPNTGPQPNPGDTTGAHQQNGALAVDLGRTADRPVVNNSFQITVTGSGAPIESVSWWADGGGSNAGPDNDDLAHVGTLSFACNGTNPCAASWTVTPRNVGFYTLHAKVRDTSGNEVQTDWQLLASENARS